MASRSERVRNNVKAGILVTVAIMLALAVVIVLEDATAALHPKSEYVIRFPVATGVEGLAAGSEVKIGGMRRGAVRSIKPVSPHGQLVHIDVQIELDRDVVLYPNAIPTKELPLLGSGGWINFESVGDSTGGAALSEDSVLHVVAGAGLLARLIAPEQLAMLDQILTNIDALLAQIRADYETNLSQSTAHLQQGLADAAQLIAAFRHDYTDWRIRISSIVDNADRFTAKLNEAMDSADLMIGDVRTGVGTVQSILDEHRPAVDRIVGNVERTTANAEELSAKLSGELIERFEALVASGQEGMEQFTALANRLNTEVDLGAPRLQTALADAQLAAQQLKLATIEVRRTPWRLLYRPTNRELQHELLYEAARSFALAAGDLQATSESLGRVLDRHGEHLSADPELSERLRLMLDQSFRKYERAQDVLFTILLEETP